MIRMIVVFTLLGILSQSAHAQWLSQSITLSPGWNAVFLEVQPEPNDSAGLFDNLPVESVWAWNRQFSPTRIIDANDMVPERPQWLVYLPASDPAGASLPGTISNLHAIQGGRAYLIKLGGTQTVEWTVKGKAVLPQANWISDAYNLTGFFVAPGSEPTFAGHFAASAAHLSGTPPGNKSRYYRLDSSGSWQGVDGSAVIERGKAYWVWCQGASGYTGPMQVISEHRGALDFGDVLPEHRLKLKNETNASITVAIAKLASETPSGEASAPPPVSLYYWDSAAMGWADLSGTVSVVIPAGSDSVLRLGVKRKQMPPMAGASYQNVLSITDGLGQRLCVPVTSSGLQDVSMKGLWAGTVSVNAVSYPAGDSDHLSAKPTASEYEMRIILHVNDAGDVHLLQQAIVFWKKGTLNQDGTVNTPGRYVVFSDDNQIPDIGADALYSGAALRDGSQVARRISTSAYILPLLEDGSGSPIRVDGEYVRQSAYGMSRTGTFGTGGGILSATLKLVADDPLNPFKHGFHPDHDNLTGANNDVQQPDDVESYTVTRDIHLTFQDDSVEGATLLTWGDDYVGGTYEETIKGLYSRRLPDSQLIDRISVRGTFLIQRVVDDGQLDPG
jgi:hypothetical protein